MRAVLLAAAMTTTLLMPASAAPLCLHMSTGAMVQCWDDAKIDAALAIIRRRGGDADRDFIISIEVNRGKFATARELARYILGEGK